jgi:hypothetical protein
LLQILCLMQDAYDTALQQGLQCALENMDLRSELAKAANVQAQAVSLARSESAAEAAASKLHLQTKYATLSIVLTIWQSTCCHVFSLQAQAMHSLHMCHLWGVGALQTSVKSYDEGLLQLHCTAKAHLYHSQPENHVQVG